MFHLHSTTWRRKPYRTPTNATHTIRCIVMTCIGPLSAPKPGTEKTIRKTERALTICFRPRGSPNATTRVRIKFRRAERAQNKMGETEAGTHSLFPSAPTSRKPPPVSVFVFGALSAPKPRGNGSGHSRTVSVRADVPKATARVSIGFRRIEGAQTKRHRTQPGMRKTEAGTHVLFPSAPTSRKPSPVSVFVFGALSAPKPTGNGSGHSLPVSVRADVPKATARVSIRFRPAERAQTKPRGNGSGHSRAVSVRADVPKASARVSIRFRRAERAQTKMGETKAGTHSLFPSTSPSRKPPPVSVFVFGPLSAPKPKWGKRKRALTRCFRQRRHPESHRPCQYSFSAR